MANKARIVIVEDEREISRFLEAALIAQDYNVDTVSSGRDALKLSAAQPPDTVILDLGLPDIDGKEVIRKLREWSRVPIIVLSARDQEQEKVEALELGADDYLTKPFGTQELLARIKVALRHASRREQPAEQTYTYKELTIDLARRKTLMRGAEIHFTPTEYDLLSLLARKSGQVVTHAEMLREVWGRNAEENDHYLRIYIQRLRQKLSDDPLQPEYIFTEPGIGYRLSESK
ncbi:MAG: response regulator transcription factor [Alphaproteobacteria bacterium]|nr:response regulator transcription factor [Alphaproteobacteria bacterium]